MIEFFIFWILLGVGLGFVELSSPGYFFFLACSMGCFAAAVGAWFGLSVVIQTVIATICMGASFLLLHYWVKKHAFAPAAWEKHVTNIDALIGKTGTVVKKIVGKEYGLVKIRGEVWSAEADEGVALASGDEVVIVKVTGNKVLVKKIV